MFEVVALTVLLTVLGFLGISVLAMLVANLNRSAFAPRDQQPAADIVIHACAHPLGVFAFLWGIVGFVDLEYVVATVRAEGSLLFADELWRFLIMRGGAYCLVPLILLWPSERLGILARILYASSPVAYLVCYW